MTKVATLFGNATEPVAEAERSVRSAAAANNSSQLLGRCHTPLTHLRPPLASFLPIIASNGTQQESVASGGSTGPWWFGEDVIGNGKPGWNANTSGASVLFAIRLGPERRIVLSRLRSYAADLAPIRASLWPSAAFRDGAPPSALLGGCATVSSGGCGQPKPVDSWIVHSHWDEPISIPEHDVHTVTRNGAVGDHFLHLELLRSAWRPGPQKHCGKLMCTHTWGSAAARFKLLSITTC